MADEIRLIVGGRRYEGWKTVRVTRSLESMSGSFDLSVSDRWGGQEIPWPIAEEDACRVEVDGQVLIDGYVDRMSVSISAGERTLDYAGKDRTAALVECSAVLDRWSFRDLSIFELAKKIAEPFGVAVTLDEGVVLPKPPKKTAISPGDRGQEILERAARAAGVVLVPDGKGGLLVTRSGTARGATALVQGENILWARGDYDASERFRSYLVASQVPGTDEASANATRIRGEASDEAVRRGERTLLVVAEQGVTSAHARARADWEARIRAARGDSVSVGVLGWTQPGGEIWPLNALVPVRAPGIRVDGEMLISEVEHSIDGSAGRVTRLGLVRPDAYAPEPQAVVRKSSGGLWKELAGGAR